MQWVSFLYSSTMSEFSHCSGISIANYRLISLLSSEYKLFTAIIYSKIGSIVDSKQPLEQTGFRSRFSTIDRIHTLEQVLEKYPEFNKNLYIEFIDYAKAFNSFYITLSSKL